MVQHAWVEKFITCGVGEKKKDQSAVGLLKVTPVGPHPVVTVNATGDIFFRFLPLIPLCKNYF